MLLYCAFVCVNSINETAVIRFHCSGANGQLVANAKAALEDLQTKNVVNYGSLNVIGAVQDLKRMVRNALGLLEVGPL